MTDRQQRFLNDKMRRLAIAPTAVLLIGLAGCGVSSSPPATTEDSSKVPQQGIDAVETESNSDPVRLTTEVAAEVTPLPAPEADALFDTLASPDSSPGDWEQAQSRLMELGAAAVPTLTRELTSTEVSRREVAASGLAMLGPDSAAAAPALQAALQDESVHVRANAATALCAIPEQEAIVIPALVELLVSDDPQVRQMTAVNLSSFGTEAAPYVQELTAALERAPDDVLVPVVELLGRIGRRAESAAPQLQQIAFEQSGDAKQAAQAALEQISEKPAAE